MTRPAILLLALILGTSAIAGCGRSSTIDKPSESDTIASGYDAMSDAQKAEYDQEMAKQMEN
ncbi:hypothetical protein Enr13x_68050 [Stieleria neptunia]|uniref:Secreted protein n=1 Tax=Stieleria neptunia TaxID=2527979 RepID=A0A518I1F9_9BACT|nr:hypothetical protein [Stieleria neptunia]QDV46896.1 hypothetical protein Enr13x_68050 [Stieleria neptunia]